MQLLFLLHQVLMEWLKSHQKEIIQFADAHRILGVCLLENGAKAEARKHLLRAKELGDALADGLLKKTE